MGKYRHRVFFQDRERVCPGDSAGLFFTEGGGGRSSKRDRTEFLDFQWRASCSCGDCGIRHCLGRRRLVFLSEWSELCGRDRGAADDEDRANENETEQGFAAEKFCAGFSVCDERSAGAIGSLAAQRVESVWFAVFGVPADLRE